MIFDPVFFLGLSILLVAVSLTAVLIAAIPALQELGRAARSVEKLADTLSRELPPTLEAIRLTGLEISDLTDDVSTGVKSAGQVVKQVDESFDGARKQAQRVQTTTRSLLAGARAAWKSFTGTSSRSGRRSPGQLAPASRPELEQASSSRVSSRSRNGDAPQDEQIYPSDSPLVPDSSPISPSLTEETGASSNAPLDRGIRSPELDDRDEL